MKPIAIGTDDFKEIIESNSLFIDKTLFIKELIDDTSKVLLFPRPRRFGKSLNMSMLKYYFDISLDSNDLFKGLKILACGDKYLNEMNKYPVVSLTLKECKKATYEDFLISFKTLISNLYYNYQFLLDSPLIKEVDKEYFKRCLNEEEEKQLSLALAKLINMLEIYYNKQVIVLLDEYDAPILEGYLKGYYDNIISFMREVFSSTFKNNLNLKKGIITGILKVSKEGMFSDANNIIVHDITSPLYGDYFGFLEVEVIDVLTKYNLNNNFAEVNKWYDGYLFGNSKIYNPWSILNYLNRREIDVYWVNTGGTSLLEELIYNKDNNMIDELDKLIKNGYIENINLDVNMNLNHLNTDIDTIWTLFLFSGYLTLAKPFKKENITLKIPNLEIEKNLKNISVTWFKNTIKASKTIKYLVDHQLENFKADFLNVVLNSFSYYDVPSDYGETFYHAFCMGLLYTGVNVFDIKSNRESGLGRFDLVLIPKKNKYAYIIEFKVVKENNFEEVINVAFKQIDSKKYDTDFKDYIVTKIVIAFKGKECQVEYKI